MLSYIISCVFMNEEKTLSINEIASRKNRELFFLEAISEKNQNYFLIVVTVFSYIQWARFQNIF